MYNFYQSAIRRDIQKEVYKNPHFVMHLFGTEYFGVIKEKKIWPWKLKRHQILWVQLPDDEELVKKELEHAKKKLQAESGDIFLQLWIVNEIVRFENAHNIAPEFAHDMRAVRLELRKNMEQKYQLKSSFRENMPQAGIIYNVTKSDEDLFKDMNESCRKRIKKAIVQWLEFRELGQHQHETFFAKWQETAGKKWFNTITKTQYQDLLKYLAEDKWMLIGAFLDGEMIAWTICLFDGEFIICPYGFYDRKFGNIWVQHFLKFKLFSWAREHGFVYVDTGGGAPTGFPEHELVWVTKFKESLGGEKIEYYGNYDVVINKFLYWVFKLWYTLRK